MALPFPGCGPERGTGAAPAANVAARVVFAPDHSLHGSRHPAVFTDRAWVSRPRGRRYARMDRDSAIIDLLSGGLHATPRRSPHGRGVWLHVYLCRVPAGRIRPHTAVGLESIPAVGDPPGRGTKLRAVGNCLFRGPAPATPGCIELRGRAPGRPPVWRRDRQRIHSNVCTRAWPDCFESSGTTHPDR